MAIDKPHPKFIERSKRRQNTQHNIEGEKKSEDWHYPTSSLSKSYNNQDSVVLGNNKQINGSKQRTPKNQHTQIWSPDLWQRSKGNLMGKEESFQQIVRKTKYPHTLEWLPYPTYKIISKYIEYLKLWNSLRIKHAGKASWHDIWSWYLRYDTQSTGNKSENK